MQTFKAYAVLVVGACLGILIAGSFVAHSQEPLPIPKPKATTTIAAKAGEIIVVAPPAKAVDFSWDKTSFPVAEKRAIVDGNKLYLTTTVNGRYIVVVADYEAKTQTEWVITVSGGSEPPIVPPVVVPPVDDVAASLKSLAAAVKDLQVRVSALEGSKPPPDTAVAKHLTFVGAELSDGARAVTNDSGLRDWLKTSGVSVHVIHAVPAEIAKSGFTEAVKKAGGPPCVVIQDERANIIGEGPMHSVDSVKTLASRFIKR